MHVYTQYILVNKFTKETGLFQVSDLHEPLHTGVACIEALHAIAQFGKQHVYTSTHVNMFTKETGLFQVSDLQSPTLTTAKVLQTVACITSFHTIVQFGKQHVYTAHTCTYLHMKQVIPGQ